MATPKVIHTEHDTNGTLIVWPEYDGLSMDEYEEKKGVGLDDATRNEWGEVLAEVVNVFCQRLDLSMQPYMEKRKLSLKFFRLEWKTVWEKELPISFESGARLDPRTPEFFNTSVSYRLSDCVLVFKPKIETFNSSEATRSAFLEYITTGTEEAVIYCQLGADEKMFIKILSLAAAVKGYELVADKKHFVSHWIVANPGVFGGDKRQPQ